MTEKEEKALRGVYQQWPVERLVRATTIEKNEYRPAALAVMLDELKKRGVEEEKLPELSASLPPPIVIPERDTFLLPARLNRKQYAIRWLLWFVALPVVFFVIFILIHLLPDALQQNASLVFFFVWIVGVWIYRIVGLDIPRLKNAGLSPFLLFLYLVPLVGLVMQVLLFALPPKKEEKAGNNAQNAPALTSAGGGQR